MQAQATLDRTRTAMKFSLWAWAAYWPAMGVMLSLAGMRDPVSLAFALLSIASFALVVASRALSATSARTVREFLVERPLYLIAALVAVTLLGAALPAVANLGLALFSGTFLASLLLVGWRLRAHVLATGESVFRARADQVFVLLLLTIPAATLVFIDALRGVSVGNPPASVAVVNWLCFAYPPLLLLASRPFREPLFWRLPRRKGQGRKARAPAAVLQPAE